MKILIDTNIILDVLLNRQPFVEKSARLFELAEKEKLEAFITSNSVTDIVYILRKAYGMEEIRNYLLIMFSFIKILNVAANDVVSALKMDVKDFEDAIIMQCAKQNGMDIIVSRNKKDFAGSPVKCLTVDEWYDEYCSNY
ncbi:type II toxin-antitoxin system VapC family toxin [Dethiobacter alkaliphilus]|uniref:type II toxin-antitoxin system VapC family toxin n=1 Tax=Dethiobacter alkaliphilus TaxID=427926 RepID=UPI002225BD34|nr:PIN domain-containing protein [Dethiobacter alkaliphilus]MCW3489760.1 PIN domain-containing protein [Dethiobacter alkaliphilus]